MNMKLVESLRELFKDEGWWQGRRAETTPLLRGAIFR
jgi:hypothetical protein